MKNISTETREKVYLKYNGRCAYCGVEINYTNLTLDHIEPKRRGDPPSQRGTDKIHNLNPSCKSCNSSKSTFSIEQWREEIELKYNRLIRDSSQFRLIQRYGLIRRLNDDVIFYFEKHNPTY